MNSAKKVTGDRKATLVHDFVVGQEYEVIVRAVGPDGTLQAMELSARNSITIVGKVAVPSTPASLTAVGFLESITLTWTNPLDYDFSVMEIWRSATNNVATAVKIAEVKGITYIDALEAANITRYYWIRAVNTSGKTSDYYPRTATGAGATSIGVAATSIDDFAITATKMFTKTVILTADSWTNNSPGAGSIAWNAHSIVYNGASYPITAGNTALAYVYWTIGGATYSTSATHPALGTTAFMVAINTSGIHTLVWNSSANMVIGTAFIANLAVTNAKINDLSASKLTAGTIDASVITVSNLVVGTNVAIGTAEDAAGVTTIVGNTITTGYVNALEITVVGAVTAGSLTGLTVQTAAAGQRVVVDGTNNRIDLIEDAGTNVVLRIDDDFPGVSTAPGILISSATGAFLRLSKDAAVGVPSPTQEVVLTEEQLTIKNTDAGATSVFFAMRTASTAAIITAEYNSDTGTGTLFQGQAGTAPAVVYEVQSTGQIITAGNLQIANAGGGGVVAHTGAAYKKLVIDGLSLGFDCSGVEKMALDAAGNLTLAGTVDGLQISDMEAGADVTGNNPPQAHTHTHASTTGRTANDHHTAFEPADHTNNAHTMTIDGVDVSGFFTLFDAHATANPNAHHQENHDNTEHTENYATQFNFDAHTGAGGGAHANAIASGAAGFMSGADKAKLDAL